MSSRGWSQAMDNYSTNLYTSLYEAMHVKRDLHEVERESDVFRLGQVGGGARGVSGQGFADRAADGPGYRALLVHWHRLEMRSVQKNRSINQNQKSNSN